jgi:hypothetical protein
MNTIDDEINTNTNDWDDNFVKELERRSKDFLSGKSKSYTWEETKAAAVNSFHFSRGTNPMDSK